MTTFFKEHKNVFFVFLVLVFIFYGNSLKNKYALDDDYITVTNLKEKGKEKEFVPNHKFVSKGFSGIIKIFKSRYAHDSEGSFDYRPLTTATFAIEYGIFGQNPFMSHLINLLLYFITIWLMFCVLLKLFENHEYKFNIAFLSSILFLIHPIHTEVVDNLKCRDELLAFIFSLSALWYSLEAYRKPNIKSIFLVLLFLTLGLLSKRSAILFFAVIPLCYIFFRKVNVKIIVAMLISIVLVYFSVQLLKNSIVSEKSVRHFYHFENPLYVEKVSFLQKIIIGFKTLGFYIKFLVFPYPFRNYYGGGMFDLSLNLNLYFFIGFGFVTSCAYFIYKLKNKLLLFSILLFLGLIVPFTNFASPAPGILAERFAYFASFGYSILIAFILMHYFKNIKFNSIAQLFSKPLVYLVPVILICMIYIWNRNNNWYNKLTLFEHDIVHLEKSAKANSLIANEYFEMLRSPNKKYPDQVSIQKSIKHYTQAVGNDSSFYSAYNNVGVVYYSYLNDFSTAKKFFTLAIRHRPIYAQAYENLGNCYKQEKNIPKAYECYKKAIIINPKQYSAYMGSINLLFENKLYDKTINVVRIAHIQFPNSYELTAQEANCYLMKKDTLNALSKFEEAYNLNPNRNLAQYISKKYFEMGDSVNGAKFQNK